ncbi:MAG: family acetyltransferase [Paenibacillus sp.]|nr:family acetyltransferase [Paenibacillus sp.]
MGLDFVRITSIDDRYFRQMHELMGEIFPPEEVLAFDLWAEPLKDEGLRVVAAVHEGNVVGATEYRYYPDMGVAMTDFTIIGREGLGVGRFGSSEAAVRCPGCSRKYTIRTLWKSTPSVASSRWIRS